MVATKADANNRDLDRRSGPRRPQPGRRSGSQVRRKETYVSNTSSRPNRTQPGS